MLPPHVSQFTPGFKSLRKEANDDNPESTITSRTDIDDISRTDKDDYIETFKATRNKMMMMNTKRRISNINTVNKLL